MQTLPQTAEQPTPLNLFLIFTRIGLSSFGGGLSGWLMREFVYDRRWMTEEEFLNGLAISQALPGVNVTNMSMWIGYQLAGRSGVVASMAGMVLPPALLVIAIGSVLAMLSGYQTTHFGLAGAAAAAIGLSLAMAVTAVRRVRRRLIPICFVLAVFVAVAILRLSLVWVVFGLGPISVALEYIRLRSGKDY